jgi:hypothetical protein
MRNQSGKREKEGRPSKSRVFFELTPSGKRKKGMRKDGASRDAGAVRENQEKRSVAKGGLRKKKEK